MKCFVEKIPLSWIGIFETPQVPSTPKIEPITMPIVSTITACQRKICVMSPRS